MSFCSNCGAEIREGFTVCTACGAPVVTPEAPIAAAEPVAAPEPQAAPEPAYQPYQEAQPTAEFAAAGAAGAAGYQPYAQAQPQQPVYQQPNPTGYQPYNQTAYQPTYQPNPADNAPYMQNAGVNNQPVQQNQQYNYQQPFGAAQQGSAEYTQLAAKAKTMGIVAIVFGFIFPIVSWICGGMGISKAGKAISYAESVGDAQLLADSKKARTMCIVGIAISIVIAIISFVNLNQ